MRGGGVMADDYQMTPAGLAVLQHLARNQAAFRAKLFDLMEFARERQPSAYASRQVDLYRIGRISVEEARSCIAARAQRK
jgi:hypothetical protein